MANNSTAMEMPYEDPLSQPPWSTIIKSFVSARIVLLAIGMILNGCNSVIVYKLPENCGNHFKLIQSLAAADISLCLVDLLMLATYAYYSYDSDVISSPRDLNQIPGSQRSVSKGSECVWAVLDCLQLIVFLATLSAVSMIAVDCFLKTKIPLRYRVAVTKKRLKVAIITSWWLSFAIGLVVVFGVGPVLWTEGPKNRANVDVKILKDDNNTATSSFDAPYESDKSYKDFGNETLASFVHPLDMSLCEMFAGWSLESKGILTGLCSLLCTTLMIIVYCCICCRVKGLQQRTERQTGVQTSSRKTVITTSLIVGSFLLAWGPPSWLLLMIPFAIGTGSMRPAARALVTSAHVLQVLNATLDALIYAMRLEEIRKSYRLAFHKLKCKFSGNS